MLPNPGTSATPPIYNAGLSAMADQLYLNLWFPSFSETEMMPRALSVLKQFPFSATLPGIGFVAVHPISWTEPTLFEQTFDFRTGSENAISSVAEFIHSDNAYVFETLWDLWAPQKEGEIDLDEKWLLQPKPVKFIVYGTQFDDSSYQQDGHIQIDFGLDAPFLHEEHEFTPEVENRIKLNVQKLVNFVHDVEKNCGISGRVLWSESEENLAQKLIAKLQRVQ